MNCSGCKNALPTQVAKDQHELNIADCRWELSPAEMEELRAVDKGSHTAGERPAIPSDSRQQIIVLSWFRPNNRRAWGFSGDKIV